MVNTHRHWSDK